MNKPQKPNKTFYTIIALLFLLCITISMFWTYGTSSIHTHPATYQPEYLYGLTGLIFPIILLCIIYKPVRIKYHKLYSDVAERWKRLRHKSVRKRSSLAFSKIRRYRGLFKFVRSLKFIYNTNFWITILSTSKDKYLVFLGRLIVLIWSFGWLLYYIAIWGDFDHVHTISGNLLYSAMSSFDLFLIDINGNIIDNIDLNYLTGPLVALIGVTSVFASLSLFSLVLGMFLTRLVIHLKGNEVEITPTSNNHIYIFFEKNNKSIALAESIQKKDHKRGLVIFVECTELDDDDDDGWNNIVKVFSSQNRLRYDKIGYSNQIHLKSHVTIEDANKQYPSGINNIWDVLGLSEIKERLIALTKLIPTKLDEEDNCQNEVHFFFMSDCRDANVLRSRLLSEYLNQDLDTQELQKTIYCVSRKSGATSIIEDSCSIPASHIEVRIIDDALLSIDVLKSKQISHPIRYVDIDLNENPGTIKSSFNSLIIGFGETGRDILRYLYEFGSFLSSNDRTNERSPFNCTLIDQYIDNLKGSFISKAPALKDSAFNLANTNSKIHINFHNYSVNDVEYFDFLQRNIDSLNYIAIALGDDEINITVATEILKYARQYRDDFNNFRIFVRVYNNSSFSHLQTIARHYNEIIYDEYGIRDIIVLFGDEIEIYKYDIIVKDGFACDGKEYGDTYWKYYEIVDNRIKENKQNLGIKDKDKPLSKQEARDKQKIALFQDRENAIHAMTKLYIVGKFLQHHIEDKNKDVWEWLFNIFNVSQENIDSKRKLKSKIVEYTELSYCELPLNQLFTNLAITEHLRWNASHEILGFIYGEQKDYKHKTHSCLKPWDMLDDISDTSAIRLFDYLVVETSLFLKMKKNNLTIDLE